MFRLLLEDLLSWKGQSERKPVLLDGARQTGKSYLLKELFGKQHFPRVHVIDFLKTPEADLLFEDDLDPLRLINDLGLFLNQAIDPLCDLIIFDEIGECLKAVQSLKYIAEEHADWFICASGSNIGLLNSFPVGKVYGLTLRPMNFEEFILAVGTPPQLSAYESVDRRELVHRQLWPLLVDYFFTGGMPEVVSSWVNSTGEPLIERRRNARKIQRDILIGYERDFGKYAGKVNGFHIGQVFKNIVGQLQHSVEGATKRYRFKGVIEKKRAYRDFDNIIAWLEKTHLTSKCYVISERPRTPIRAAAKESLFKLFYPDVGLLCCELGVKESVLDMGDVIYKGPIVENYIQNELLSYGLNETYCWSENTAEIEFILETIEGVIPVEVKAGKNTQARSLRSYKERYSPLRTIKFIGAVGGTDENDQVLPLYYSKLLKGLVQ